MILQLLISQNNYFTIRQLDNTLEDKDYQKGSARMLIHGDLIGLVEVASQGFIVLVSPTYFGDWQDEFGVPYPTKEDLIIDLRDSAFVKPLTWEDITGDPADNQDLVDFVQGIADGKVEWKNKWVNDGGTYQENDMVRDGSWLMIANKETTDRPAPQPLGLDDWINVPKVDGSGGNPPWTTGSNISVVYTRHRYVFTKGGWITGLRIWVPELTSNTNYRIILIDRTDPANPVTEVLEEPVLTVNAWTVVTLANAIAGVGRDLEIVLDSYNSATSINITGGWNRQGNQNNNTPTSGGWNRRNQNNVVRFNFVDLDSVNREGELDTIIPNTTITITNTGDVNQNVTYLITSVTKLVDSYEFDVSQQAVGVSGEPPVGADCQCDFDVPQLDSTQFVQEAGYFATPPSFCNVTTALEYNGVDQGAVATTGYGIDISFQEAQSSEDWDFTAFSDIKTSSTDTKVYWGNIYGDVTRQRDVAPEAPDQSNLWLRKEGTWVKSQDLATNPLWKYDDDTTATDPTDGYVKFNTLDLTIATEIYISNVSEQGVNFDFLFSRVGKKSLVRAQQWASFINSQVFLINNRIDNGGWYTFEVTPLLVTISPFGNNSSIDFDVLSLVPEPYNEYVESEAEDTTSQDIFQNKATIIEANLPVGDYRWEWSAEVSCSTANRKCEVEFEQNAVTQNLIAIEPKDTGNWYSIGGFRRITHAGGAMVLNMQFRRTGGGGGSMAMIRRARIELKEI